MDLKDEDLKVISTCVINLAKKFSVRQDNWDDLIHDVYLYILENTHTYDSSRPKRAWLYTVSRNTTLRFVMQYKMPVIIPKSTWQRQTADIKSTQTNQINDAISKGFDPTISRLYLERNSISTEYKDDAGYVFRETIECSSPYKLYEEAKEEPDMISQLKSIAKKQHPTIDWWFESWLDSPRTTSQEDRETILLNLREEICRRPKVQEYHQQLKKV